MLYILFFSFSHSEVDILLPTQCLSLNFDAKIYISAVRSQAELSIRCPRAQVEVCMHAPISYSEEYIKNNIMKTPTVLINWRCRCGYKGRLKAIYFTSFDFDYHDSKLAHVHHVLDKFSFN